MFCGFPSMCKCIVRPDEFSLTWSIPPNLSLSSRHFPLTTCVKCAFRTKSSCLIRPPLISRSHLVCHPLDTSPWYVKLNALLTHPSELIFKNSTYFRVELDRGWLFFFRSNSTYLTVLILNDTLQPVVFYQVCLKLCFITFGGKLCKAINWQNYFASLSQHSFCFPVLQYFFSDDIAYRIWVKGDLTQKGIHSSVHPLIQSVQQVSMTVDTNCLLY